MTFTLPIIYTLLFFYWIGQKVHSVFSVTVYGNLKELFGQPNKSSHRSILGVGVVVA